MDQQRFTAQMEIVDRYFESTEQAIPEGAVGGAGYRRLLRFDTVLMNRGNGDKTGTSHVLRSESDVRHSYRAPPVEFYPYRDVP